MLLAAERPHPAQTARAIVANPTIHHSPTLRLIAWATVKAERGQTIRQINLQAPRPANPQVA